jgi:hypothetical protein
MLVGLALAGGNFWVTAARSTIPIGLDARIAELEIRHEKHPGFDDVFFLVFEGGRRIHVDQPVFRGLAVGDFVEKRPGDRSIEITRSKGATKFLPLEFSSDFHGMCVVMPIALGIAVVLAVAAGVRQLR